MATIFALKLSKKLIVNSRPTLRRTRLDRCLSVGSRLARQVSNSCIYNKHYIKTSNLSRLFSTSSSNNHNNTNSNANSNNNPKVLIIGGGPCGAMTALALQRIGIESIVFERKSGNYEDEGSGMLLHGGAECMKYLGLKDELYSITSRNDLIYKGMNNNTFVNLPNSSIFKKYGVEQRWCLRKDLFKILQEKCRTTKGINYLSNKKLINYTVDNNNNNNNNNNNESNTNTVTAEFSDGTSYQGNILIGCDGINSKVRKILKGAEINKKCKEYSGFSFWYLYGKLDKSISPMNYEHSDDNNGYSGLKNTNVNGVATIQTGDGCFGLFFPIMSRNEYALLFGYRSEIETKYKSTKNSKNNEDNNNNNNKLIGVDDGAWGVEQSREELSEWFYDKVGFNKMAANNNGVFEKYIENATKINKFSVHNVVLDKNEKWYDTKTKTKDGKDNSRVILLGDAAHAITPFGGHGCNLAFYDAICMGYLMDKHMFNEKYNNNDIVLQIFNELYNIRSGHCYEIQNRAQRMGGIYSLPKDKHKIRDTVFTIANKLGISEKMFAKMLVPQVGFDLLKETKDINESELRNL